MSYDEKLGKKIIGMIFMNVKKQIKKNTNNSNKSSTTNKFKKRLTYINKTVFLYQKLSNLKISLNKILLMYLNVNHLLNKHLIHHLHDNK